MRDSIAQNLFFARLRALRVSREINCLLGACRRVCDLEGFKVTWNSIVISIISVKWKLRRYSKEAANHTLKRLQNDHMTNWPQISWVLATKLQAALSTNSIKYSLILRIEKPERKKCFSFDVFAGRVINAARNPDSFTGLQRTIPSKLIIVSVVVKKHRNNRGCYQTESWS